MILAPAAPPGSTIGVATPATPPPRRSDVLRGIEWWEANGYRVQLAPNWRDVAGTPEQRARDLQELFADPEVDVIQTMRGGYGSAEVVPLLDYDAITASPKAFLGFSDITALHCALGRFAGLVTFYAPSLTRLAARPVPQLTGDRLLRVLRGETTGPVPWDPDGPPVRTIAGGRASGRVVGGCMPDLVHTFLTPWEVETEDAILFFEVASYGPTIKPARTRVLRSPYASSTTSSQAAFKAP